MPVAHASHIAHLEDLKLHFESLQRTAPAVYSTTIYLAPQASGFPECSFRTEVDTFTAVSERQKEKKIHINMVHGVGKPSKY